MSTFYVNSAGDDGHQSNPVSCSGGALITNTDKLQALADATGQSQEQRIGLRFSDVVIPATPGDWRLTVWGNGILDTLSLVLDLGHNEYASLLAPWELEAEGRVAVAAQNPVATGSIETIDGINYVEYKFTIPAADMHSVKDYVDPPLFESPAGMCIGIRHEDESVDVSSADIVAYDLSPSHAATLSEVAAFKPSLPLLTGLI